MSSRAKLPKLPKSAAPRYCWDCDGPGPHVRWGNYCNVCGCALWDTPPRGVSLTEGTMSLTEWDEAVRKHYRPQSDTVILKPPNKSEPQ